MKHHDQDFDYSEAFSRNIGWITEIEQLQLRDKRVAIAGMGGVGGVHLLTLARLGIGAFHISDMDRFEIANFNRQVGATIETIGRPKVDVLAEQAGAINPQAEIIRFAEGIDEANIDAFLAGVDLFVDGFDFFVIDIRAKVFARCAELGIPAITAAPIGLGTAYIVFMPGRMSFEEYFGLKGLPEQKQYVNFLMGLVPKGLHRTYLMDPTRLDLAGRRGPSSVAACQLCAGVTGVEALKILLGRGRVRAAPYFHQFDAYRGRWVARRRASRRWNPFERLKLRLAYKGFEALSRNSWQAPARASGSELVQILDLARWAPSGDNTQPWRFEILDDETVIVHIRDQSDHDVYDYDGGQPSLLSAGMLLETIRLAATKFGRIVWWQYEGSEGHDHQIRVECKRGPGMAPDLLATYIPLRSVDRRSYRREHLTPEQRQELAAALGDELEIRWHETARERKRIARINGIATDIRLRIPEAYQIHRKIIDWEGDRSQRGIPARATGLDGPTLAIMRWAMRDWSRVERMNRLPGGTFQARLQMDYRPGRHCAAFFSIARRQAATVDERVPSLLRHGQALQRFWLTATRLGLAMQPAMATLIFAYYGRHGIDFTASPEIRRQAADLSIDVRSIHPGPADDVLFLGRIGWPRSAAQGARSIRRPLEDLILKGVELPATANGDEEETASASRSTMAG